MFSVIGGPPRGLWRLGTSLTDLSGGGNNGSATGTSVLAGRNGPARFFNGTNSDYVSLGTGVPVPAQGVFSFWIKFSDFTTGKNGSYLNIFSKRDPDTGGTGRFMLRYLPDSGVVFFYFYESTNPYSKSWTLPFLLVVNAWYHFGLQYDVKNAGNSTLVVNGVPVAITGDQTIPGTWAETNSSNLRLARTENNASSYKGWMQDFVIIPGLIGAKQIQDYYTRATTTALTSKVFKLPGGVTNVVISESLAISDTLNRQATLSRALVESLTIADALSYESALTRKLAESLDISDALRYEKYTYSPPLVEALTIADSLSRNITLSRKLLENLSIGDILTKSAEYSRKLTESLTISDTLSANRFLSPPKFTESLSISDTLRYNKGRKLSETLSISDTLRTTKTLSRKLTESLTLVSNFQVDKASSFFSNVYGELDIYTDTYWLQDENTLTPFLFASVYGEFNINQIVNFISKTNLYTLPLQLNIYQRVLADPLQLVVNLREGNVVFSSVSGSLDIYLTELPPTITQIGQSYSVSMVVDGVSTDISSKLTSFDINYSVNKYVGEFSATFKDEKLYEILHIKNYFGKRIFVVYIDGQNVGEFFFESRSGDADFTASQLSVWGRTKNALLGPPYSGRLNKSWDSEETTALDIVKEVLLPYPDIVLQWNIMNYSILPGKVSADGRSVVELISSLAEPVGGRLTTNFAGDLIVDYKWKSVTS